MEFLPSYCKIMCIFYSVHEVTVLLPECEFQITRFHSITLVRLRCTNWSIWSIISSHLVSIGDFESTLANLFWKLPEGSPYWTEDQMIRRCIHVSHSVSCLIHERLWTLSCSACELWSQILDGKLTLWALSFHESGHYFILLKNERKLFFINRNGK